MHSTSQLYLNQNNSMIKNFFIILKNAKKIRILHITLLFFLTIISITFEILSVGSLVPFIDIITNNLNAFKDSKLNIYNFAADHFFYMIENKKIIYMSIFIILVIISYLLKILLIWFAAHLTHSIGHEINLKIFTKTVFKKYNYHLKTNSSRFLGNIEKSERFKSSIAYIFQLGISLSMCIAILIFIFFIDAIFILYLCVAVIIAYFLIFIFLNKKMSANSKIEASEIDSRIQILQETSSNIREIIISSLQNNFLFSFKKIDDALKRTNIKNIIYSNIPGNFVQMFATVMLSIIIYIFSLKTGGLVTNLSFLAAIMFALQKLLPQAQFVYSSYAKLKMHSESVNDVRELIMSDDDNLSQNSNLLHNEINFNYLIKINQGEFFYNTKEDIIFKNLNIQIKKNKSLLILGDTGAGKSTLIDIIMNLIELKSGNLLIDDVPITPANSKSWQKKISHIPQQAGFFDSSILENIVLKSDFENVNKQKLYEVAKAAEIFDFINSQEKKYETLIGERGVRLSGGQRQRIAISRALYSDKEVIFFDEATNALDSETEKKVLNNILGKNTQKTIIVISHRENLSTFFDHVLRVKNNSVIQIK
jgi:ABC-type multidrug transport system fused ATPase/permease subunit